MTLRAEHSPPDDEKYATREIITLAYNCASNKYHNTQSCLDTACLLCVRLSKTSGVILIFRVESRDESYQ